MGHPQCSLKVYPPIVRVLLRFWMELQAQDLEKEGHQVGDASDPKGFLPEAEGPLETYFSHSQRGAPELSREDVQASSYPDDDRHLKFLKMQGDPFFLPGDFQGCQEDFRAGLSDLKEDPRFFLGREVSVAGSEDSESGMLFFEVFRGGLRDPRPGAQEVEAPVFFLRQGAEDLHQINAWQAGRSGAGQKPTGQGDPHGIRQDAVGLSDDSAELGIFKAGMEHQGIERDELMRGSGGNPGFHQGGDFWKAQRIQGYV